VRMGEPKAPSAQVAGRDRRWRRVRVGKDGNAQANVAMRANDVVLVELRLR